MRMALILVLFTSSLFSEMAQLRLLSQQPLENEFVQDLPERRDKNGVLSALLKVRSDLSGLTFRSGLGVVSVDDSRTGEYLLFLAPSERWVEIYSSQHEPFMLLLREENIHLRSAKVWEVRISGDATRVNSIPVRFTANILCTLYVNGVQTGMVTPQNPLNIELVPRPYFIELFPDTEQEMQFTPIRDTLLIARDQFVFDKILVEKPKQTVALQLPPLATHSLTREGDTVVLKKQGDDYLLYEGVYLLTTEKSGYVTSVERIVVQPPAPPQQVVVTLQKDEGRLHIALSASKAALQLNGQKSAPGLHTLPSGTYTITATLEGYHPETRSVLVSPHKEVHETITMRKLLGALSVTTTLSGKPPGATDLVDITVRNTKNDIILRGEKSIKSDSLPVGRYTVSAISRYHHLASKRAEIRLGALEEVQLNLISYTEAEKVNAQKKNRNQWIRRITAGLAMAGGAYGVYYYDTRAEEYYTRAALYKRQYESATSLFDGTALRRNYDTAIDRGDTMVKYRRLGLAGTLVSLGLFTVSIPF